MTHPAVRGVQTLILFLFLLFLSLSSLRFIEYIESELFFIWGAIFQYPMK
jgi:hypothetical protein